MQNGHLRLLLLLDLAPPDLAHSDAVVWTFGHQSHPLPHTEGSGIQRNRMMKKNCGSGGSNKIKAQVVCILEADESTRMRMGNSIPHHHENHIAGKGENSLQHYNLVHNFVPMPQAMKIPAAKAVVDKEWEKLEKISAWNLTKVRNKKQVIDKARTSGATVHFASLMDICHLKNAELEAKHQKTKVELYSVVML